MPRDFEIRQRMMRARSALLLEHPFFGHLAIQLELTSDPDCDTAWSDGCVLAYNPLYVRMLPDEKLKGLMGHLVMHPACRHHLRREGRDRGRWNMACDYAINWILLEAGLELPDGYLDDPALRGKTADEIYARLSGESGEGRPDSAENRNERPESDGGEETEAPEDAAGSGTENASGEEEDSGEASPAKAAADADTAEEDRQFDSGDPGRAGEVRDAPPPDGESGGGDDGDDHESQWRLNLAQAANQARSMGDLPAGLARLVEEMISPRLDWRTLLSRFLQDAARHDYAWMPPNRRYVHRGLYLPGLRSDDLPEVVVALDTSGSVSARELDQFAAELSAILETSAMTLHLLYCDIQVAKHETVHRQDLPLKLAPVGGGGTDFRPAFDWVADRNLRPACFVYLTDLACNRFPDAPDYPVLWACTGEEEIAPPFGEVVAVR
jgi:predicted metal-dependent peptidase